MRGIGRWEFLAWGVGLALLKFALDCAAAAYFGASFSAERYWKPFTQGILSLAQEQRPEALALALIATPSVCAGVWLSVLRLRRIGGSPAFAFLFFVPLFNLAFFVGLFAAGDAAEYAVEQPQLLPKLQGIRMGMLPAAAVVGAGGVVLAAFCTLTLHSYGWGLFLAVPFAMGVASDFLVNRNAREPGALKQSVATVLLAESLFTALLLAFAIEGAICLAMAAPIGIILGVFGAVLGNAIRSPGTHRWAGPMALPVAVVAAPLSAGIERAWPPRAALYRVDSFVEIDAPPARVWPVVIAFPEIKPPSELMFRAGIAYPLRARIEGNGVGAIRYCEFSTGPFVEPITIWEPAKRLAFSVTQNPEPMRELSFREIHPPHMHGFLESQQGEFRLEPLDGGRRTRLHGSTWYKHGLEPAGYWRWWSDGIIHRIHGRVLEHIKKQVELTN